MSDPTEASTTGSFKLSQNCVYCTRDIGPSSEPQLLPCLHTACKKCLTPLKEQTTNQEQETPRISLCPVCNQEFLSTDVMDHLFLVENIPGSEALRNEDDQAGQIKCTGCEDNAAAYSFCTDCVEWLCKVCLQAHQRVQVTKNHSVQSIEDMQARNLTLSVTTKKYSYCSDHPKEKLKVYCESCDKLTCRDCLLENHKNHKYMLLPEACRQQKKVFNNLLSEIMKKRAFLDKACDLMRKRQIEIEEKEIAVKREIKDFAIRSISEINYRGKSLTNDLKRVCDQKKKQLLAKTNELNRFLEKLKECQALTELTMKNGSELAILHSKKALSNRAKHLLRQNCDIPNPKYQVDIRLNYDANSVSEYIRNIGCLIVDQLPVVMSNSGVTISSSSNSPHSVVVTNNRVGTSSSTSPMSRVKLMNSIACNVVTSQTVNAATFMNRPQSVNLPPPPQLMKAQRPEGHVVHITPPSSMPVLEPAVTGTTLIPRFSFASNTMGIGMPRVVAPVTSTTNLTRNILHVVPSNLSNPTQSDPVLRHLMRTTTSVVTIPPPYPAAIYRSGAPSVPLIVSPCQIMTQVVASSVPAQAKTATEKPSPPATSPVPVSNPDDNKRFVAEATVTEPLQEGPVVIEVASASEPIRQETREADKSPVSSEEPVVEALSPSEDSTATELVVAVTDSSQDDGKQHDNLVVVKKEIIEIENDPDNYYKDDVNGTNGDAEEEGSSSGQSDMPVSGTSTEDNPNRENNMNHESSSEVESSTSDEGFGKGSNEGHRLGSKMLQVVLEDASPRASEETKSRKRSIEIPQLSPKMPVPVRTHRRERLSKGTYRMQVAGSWCAVCQDGGELICCGMCPRVYHLSCHVPSLNPTPSDDWICNLCRDVNSYVQPQEKEKERDTIGSKRKRSVGLQGRELMICERILLELFCHASSQPFHHPVSRTVSTYRKVITKPMDFTTIKLKLSPTHFNHYADVGEFLDDVRQVFENCRRFNPEGSELHTVGQVLNNFLEDMLFEFLPDYASKTTANTINHLEAGSAKKIP